MIHPETSSFVDYIMMVPESIILRKKMFTSGSCEKCGSNGSKNPSLLGLWTPICIMKCPAFAPW
jgi:hypothetical protein